MSEQVSEWVYELCDPSLSWLLSHILLYCASHETIRSITREMRGNAEQKRVERISCDVTSHMHADVTTSDVTTRALMSRGLTCHIIHRMSLPLLGHMP